MPIRPPRVSTGPPPDARSGWCTTPTAWPWRAPRRSAGRFPRVRTRQRLVRTRPRTAQRVRGRVAARGTDEDHGGRLAHRTLRRHVLRLPRHPGNKGLLQFEHEQLSRYVLDAHRCNWQIATHAIGDAALDAVLDAYEEARLRYPRPDARHRVEYAAVTSERQVARIAATGLVCGTDWPEHAPSPRGGAAVGTRRRPAEGADRLHRVQAVDPRGIWVGLKHELRHMHAHGSGTVVNCSSRGGLVGTPARAACRASPHCVIGDRERRARARLPRPPRQRRLPGRRRRPDGRGRVTRPRPDTAPPLCRRHRRKSRHSVRRYGVDADPHHRTWSGVDRNGAIGSRPAGRRAEDRAAPTSRRGGLRRRQAPVSVSSSS
ncbi:amidohydrolase family protein [Streptomyces tendae]|uniref:amidohydrolase family protein n=1 Tax=Streptomyces tendae TaxID=1932 RepID=UPI0034491BA9